VGAKTDGWGWEGGGQEAKWDGGADRTGAGLTATGGGRRARSLVTCYRCGPCRRGGTGPVPFVFFFFPPFFPGGPRFQFVGAGLAFSYL
jgi:hypothetical protein